MEGSESGDVRILNPHNNTLKRNLRNLIPKLRSGFWVQCNQASLKQKTAAQTVLKLADSFCWPSCVAPSAGRTKKIPEQGLNAFLQALAGFGAFEATR